MENIYFLLLFSFYKSHTFLQIGEWNDYLPNQLSFFPCQFPSKLLTGYKNLKKLHKRRKVKKTRVVKVIGDLPEISVFIIPRQMGYV